MPAKIVILNGTSSAGKSSIANAFKNVLPNFYHLSIDHFWRGLPDTFQSDAESMNPDDVGAIYEFSEDKQSLKNITLTPKGYQLMESIHAAISAFCAENINVVYDAFIADEQILIEAAHQLSDHEVYFVGLRCSDDERRRRETKRGDRASGTYNLRADFIYGRCQYDIEIDTSNKTPEEVAMELALIIDSVSPRVFQNVLKQKISNLII